MHLIATFFWVVDLEADVHLFEDSESQEKERKGNPYC